MRRLFYLLPFLLLFFLVSNAQAQPTLIALNVFLRGIQLPDGVRYTASVVKPSDDTAMRNVSVEITLPADALLMEMLISRQVEFDVVRRNQAGQLTLIWQISRVPADAPLDSFSFTLAQPLSGEVEFYTVWQNEDGLQRVENFYEVPPLTVATQSEFQWASTNLGFAPVGDTGIQIAAPSLGILLTGRVLPVDFNPPVEYGNLWWCSLLEINGLPAGTTADVIVPLRRSLAPFTPVQLYQQQSDGSWLVLDQQGIVTADGQYAMYVHPGGIVATGVPAEFQSEILPAAEIVIEQVIDVRPPDPQSTNAPGEIADGSSNTIFIGEGVPPTDVPPPPASIGQITDGSSDTVFIGEVVSPTDVPPPPTSIGQITDGSSNTVFIGEGASPTDVPPPPTTVGQITDGSSNTIIIGEGVPPTLTTDQTTANFADVSVTQEGTVVRTQVINAVDSPTIESATAEGDVQLPNSGTIGHPPTNAAESSITVPTLFTIPSVTPSPENGVGQITDGSSNTISIGEATPTPPFFTATALPQPPASTPFTAPVIPNPFGQGGGRLEIIVGNSGAIVQCQFGRVNCANLQRRLGAGLR